MTQSGGEPNERLRQFEGLAREAHEAAAAELRQRPPFPLNDLTYLANYVAIFEAYFRQRGRREA